MPFRVSELFLEAVYPRSKLKLAYNFQEQPILSNAIDTTKIKDLSPEADHGTITGSIIDAPGKFGRARDFQKGAAPTEIAGFRIASGTVYTVGFWINTRTVADMASNRQGVAFNYPSATNDGFIAVLWENGALAVMHLNGGASVVRFDMPWAARVNEWHRVIFVLDGAIEGRSYLDGAPFASAIPSATPVTLATNWRLGDGVYPFAVDGRIDGFFAIEGEAWTDADALADFENGGIFIIPGHKVRTLSLDEAEEDLLDELTATVYNDAGEFRDHLALGREVKLYMRTQQDTEALLRWTGITKKPKQARSARTRPTLQVEAGDYVYEIMLQRQFFDTFVNKDAGQALKDMLAAKTGELDTTLVQVGTNLIDYTSDGDRVKDVAFRLASMAGQQLKGDALKRVHFFPAGTQDSGLTADYTKVDNFMVGPDDTKVANAIRVEGGEGIGTIQEQLTQTALFTVTDTIRKQQKILTPKRKVKQAEIHTDPTGFTGNLILRIQADDGTGLNPIAIGDATQDIARKELDATFLAVGGLTTFLIPSHILGAGNEYWLIMESDTAAGQRVGTDAGGNLTFRASFAFPIIEVVENSASIADIGRREDKISDPSIVTKAEAKDRARLEIAKRAVAERMADFDLRDPALLAADPGEGLVLDMPDEGVALEKFIVHRRRWHVQDAVASVDFSLVETERLIGAADVIKNILDRLARAERFQVKSTGEEIPDIFMFEADSYDYGDAATLTVDTVLGMIWGTDKWDLEVWSD